MPIRVCATARITNTMNKNIENQGGGDLSRPEDQPREEIKFPIEGYVPSPRFDASIPLNVHLQDVGINYVELSLVDGRPFAFVFFDCVSHFLHVKGMGAQICTFNQPLVIGTRSLQYYPGFFDDKESSVAEEHCVVELANLNLKSGEIWPYPIIKIENKSPQGAGTFCRVFQNPKPRQ